MIAAVCAWHEHHTDAADEITRRLRAEEPMFIAAPAMVESFAVLTRLPLRIAWHQPPHWPSSRGSFLRQARIIALDGRSYRTLVHRLAETQITGGRVYDGVIAECALRERDMALLTFNEHESRPFLAGA